MSFVSYAPSFEDVLLWRALKAVQNGCYIDLGPGFVGRAFDEHGWHGKTAEPGTALVADCCRELDAGVIHFLRVAGADALVEADVASRRPWIVLVASADAREQPLLVAAGYQFAWFDGLNRFYLAEEYGKALAPCFGTPPNAADGFVTADAALADARAQSANRRQLDAVIERAEELVWLRSMLDAARLEAQGLREALRASEAAVEHHLAARKELEAAAAWRGSCADTAERRLAELDGLVRELDARVQARDEQLWDLNAVQGALDAQIADLDARLRDRDFSLKAIYGSTVWRITAPLRWRWRPS